MQQANAALTAALRAGDRSEKHTTRLGGVEVGPQVQSWALESAYGTDLPDAMRAWSGSASAQLELSLAGTRGATAPALYGPWAPHATADIARPGQSVVHAWGLGEDTLPAFRGQVRARSAQSGTDTVRITALDGAERLRMPAQLPRPSGGIDQGASGFAETDWVASATWCVDHLLRRAGIHTSPPPRPDCTLYVSYHGGAAANIGTLYTLTGGWNRWDHPSPPFTAAARGPETGQAIARYVPTVRGLNRSLGSAGYWHECWFDTTGPGSTNQQARLEIHWATEDRDWRTALEIDWSNRRVRASSGTTDTVPDDNPSLTWNPDQMRTEAPGRWHCGFWVRIANDGTTTVEFRLTPPSGNTIYGLSADIPQIQLPPGVIQDVSVVLGDLAVEGMQFTPMPSIPADLTQAGWKRGAVLDPPAHPVTVIPVVSGSAWDVITSIAKATVSTAEFDQSGLFRWRNGSRWTSTPATADITVSSARELAALTVTEEIDACRNWIRVRWRNWARVKSVTTYKESAELLLIPPGQTINVSWVSGEDQLDAIPPVTRGDGAPGTIRFSFFNDDGTSTVHGAVEVGMSRVDGLTTMSLRNTATLDVYCRPAIWGQGTSYSVLTPTLPTDNGPEDTWVTMQNSESQRAYGRQVYDHDAAGWVQEITSAAYLAVYLLDAGRLPVPLLGDVEILPDPRVRLGDVVRVIDRTGAQLDTLAWVVGSRVTGGDSAAKQTLTLRGTASPGFPTDVGLAPDPPTA
ncbi:hypothetical protein OG196_15195 [Kitasatospora purpeofusca]|uniref:hypothetical protein n=1 Tax=Kitasatospora purpeofusca TaxID=67352 RepID=UPI002E0D1F64|nr:hypothetical protein OG196_15195 [Kitasatospora purpeofusca]